MIARGVAMLLGSAVLAAMTHVTVQHTGGYGSSHSYVVIAVAAGVGAGSVFYNMARADQRYALAWCLLGTILAGEAFGLYQTTSRLVAASQAQQTPLREYAKTHVQAKADVEAAAKALANADTSERLTKANEAKRAADKAVTNSAKEMGCRTHCKELLQNAVNDAKEEVENARAEIAENKAKAETALQRANEKLAVMKAPESPTPLADLTGIAAWKLDLSSAILGSIGGNGLACCLLIFGVHSPRREATPLEPIVEPEVQKPRTQRNRKVDGTPRQLKPLSPRDHAARFALERLTPHGNGAELTAIRQEYRAWSAARPERYSEDDVSRELAELFAKAGITISERDGRLVVLGVSLKEPQSQPLRLAVSS
jgi:hypothetical protein